jgi:hypothetical protein
VFDELAPTFGFALFPSIIHVFDELAPTFGFNSFPSQTQVLEDDAPTFGLISLPDIIQVFDDDAPVFGFNSIPLHTQLLGRPILIAMKISFFSIGLHANSINIWKNSTYQTYRIESFPVYKILSRKN